MFHTHTHTRTHTHSYIYIYIYKKYIHMHIRISFRLTICFRPHATGENSVTQYMYFLCNGRETPKTDRTFAKVRSTCIQKDINTEPISSHIICYRNRSPTRSSLLRVGWLDNRVWIRQQGTIYRNEKIRSGLRERERERELMLH